MVLAESELPPDERFFTIFKIEGQKNNENEKVRLREKFLTDNKIVKNDADDLIGLELGFTRKVIDKNIFVILFWIWIFIIISGSILFLNDLFNIYLNLIKYLI